MYNLHGVNYVALISLCESMNINWDYDTFTRRVALNRDSHQINLAAGQALVLVDGRAQYLKHPVDIYNGTVVVPYKFKEQILDALFKRPPVATRVVRPELRIKKIVIDAGHGGTDPGAVGKGNLREKDINLDIAKRLSVLLRKEGVETVLTRSSDIFISLERRVAIANSSAADLFISIHSNSNRVRSLGGFEVYYVSAKVSDSSRALSAAANAALDLDQSSFAGPVSANLKAILWDMVYTSDRADAIKLARNICHSIDGNLNTRVIGVKSAGFYVLKGVRMPAVLIEVGFVSNYNEERLLRNSYYRQQVAEAIFGGIQDYSRSRNLMEASR